MNHEGSIGGIGSAELKQDTTFSRQPAIASRTSCRAICCGRSQSVSAYPEHHTTDVNADGVTNVLDLIDRLLCFGLPAAGGCESPDINGDCFVTVLDVIDLLRSFGGCARSPHREPRTDSETFPQE